MQAISRGEVYYVGSPFKCNPTDPNQVRKEKRLAYLVGSVSARPVLVIREPKIWDSLGTVVVLPALSHEKPAFSVEMFDRYCHFSMIYKFCPHMPHTIPVSRLGRYIGRLSPVELEEVTQAFNWIMGDGTGEDIPPMYREVVANGYRLSHENRTSPPPLPTLYATCNSATKTTTISTEHGTKDPLEMTVTFDMDAVVMPSEQDLALEDLYGKKKPTRVWTISAEDNARWPDSTVSEFQLKKYANEFSIPERFYATNPKLTTDMLTDDEENEIRGGALSGYDYQCITDTYKNLTYFDQTFLAPRLPALAIADVFHIPSSYVNAFKVLANIMLEMVKSGEYSRRIAEAESHVETVDSSENDTADSPDGDDSIVLDPSYYEELRPYMNEKQICSVPEKLQTLFVQAPTWILKAMYTGKSFKYRYGEAMSRYANK